MGEQSPYFCIVMLKLIREILQKHIDDIDSGNTKLNYEQ